MGPLASAEPLTRSLLRRVPRGRSRIRSDWNVTSWGGSPKRKRCASHKARWPIDSPRWMPRQSRKLR